MVPWRLVRNEPGLTVVDAPVDVPGYEMAMLWHDRCHRDPAHVWLRELVATCTSVP
jgi:DNA-binding transcriptional LysR family regulator